jgi:hypothetical protein
MRLQIDRMSLREMGRAADPPPELRRYYECANKSCEFECAA